jgi:hypothetical protein
MVTDSKMAVDGQQEDGGYERSRFNATRHGLTSRHVLLPWENPVEFEALREALLDEHQPKGMTEQHLVDELTALIWRKQRVLQAECAGIRDELRESLDLFSAGQLSEAALIHVEDNAPNAAAEAIRNTDAEATADLADHEACETRARKAIAIIDRGGDQAYVRALKSLHADTREWWTEEREDPDSGEDERPEPTASALREFLDETVLPFHAQRMMAVRHRHLLRSQAFGMAVRRADLERLGRYETTLDRKLQRILGMLLQLQDRRRTINAPAA